MRVPMRYPIAQHKILCCGTTSPHGRSGRQTAELPFAFKLPRFGVRVLEGDFRGVRGWTSTERPFTVNLTVLLQLKRGA
jgi:hypothetical protein